MRRALLGLAIAAAPVLQVAGMLPHPEVGETAAQTLAVVAEDPGLWTRIHLTAAAAAALFAVAAVVLASLVRRRGAALATAGAALLVLGCGALTAAFAAEAHLLPLAADPSLDRSAMVSLAGLEEGSPVMSLLTAGFPLTGIGTLMLMAGLLRSGAVPRWQPALVVVGTVASLGAPPGSALGPVLLAPAVAGYLGLAWMVGRQGAQPSPATVASGSKAPGLPQLRTEGSAATVQT